MLRNNEQGILEGQETIDKIKGEILQFKEQIRLEQQKEAPSPFQHISRKLVIQKGRATQEEILASYMEEVKKDLMKNLGMKNISSNTSMASASQEDEEFCLAGESQSMDEPLDEDTVERIMKNIEQSISDKGKAPI